MLAEQQTIRQYLPTDRDKIIGLLDTAFKGWPHFDLDCSPKDHWDWKFVDNPLKRRMITVAEIDDKIVGCDHLLFTKVKIGKQVLPVGQAVDSAVHPDYRGLGIYSKMRDFAGKRILDPESHTPIVYAASTNSTIIKKEGKLGSISFPYQIEHLIRIPNIDLHLRMNGNTNHNLPREILIKTGYNAIKILNSTEKLFINNKVVNKNLKIVDTNKFDEKIDVFWRKIKDQYYFIMEKSKEYLSWRYCDSRGGNFTIKQAEEDGEVVGYIVLRVNNFTSDYPSGYVVDLCTLPDHLDCAGALIAESLRFFDNRKINIVNYIIDKGHPFEALFERFGFVNSQHNLFVSYTSTIDSSELNDFMNSPPSKLLFQYGDIDFI
jgi:hypothetical protein